MVNYESKYREFKKYDELKKKGNIIIHNSYRKGSIKIVSGIFYNATINDIKIFCNYGIIDNVIDIKVQKNHFICKIDLITKYN